MAVPEHVTRDWLGAYRALLANQGLNAADVLSAALQPAPEPQPALFSLAQMLAQPELLTGQLDQESARKVAARGPEHDRLHRATLTVLHQDFALKIIAPLVLRLFRDGAAPAPDPERIFLCHLDSGNSESHWRQVPANGPALQTEAFIAAISEQMSAWYPVFRVHYGVSPGAYWSSVGLALGAPFSAVWNRADPTTLCALATAWLNQFRCDANRFIDWIPAQFSNQPCALPQRRGCCLKYLLPDGGYCGTCGIYRKERLKALSLRCK